MGGRKCCLEACPSNLPRNTVHGVTFHRFPMNLAKRKIWIKQCRVSESMKIAKTTFICSLHFNKEDFQEDKVPKAILKTAAYPTRFPWGTYNTEEPDTSGELGDEELKLSEDEGGATSNNENLSKSPNKSPAKRSASAEEFITEPAKKVIRKTSDSAILSTSLMMTPPKKDNDLLKASLKFDRVPNFTPGTIIEAQDFNKSWHSAKIVEVDSDDREVLVHFETSLKGKTPSNIDEWISMDSSRLRPIQLKSSPSKKPTNFVIGEKCFARWSDCRKFPGTVQTILPENNFEILFDDGYTKIVRGIHMTKIKKGSLNKFSPMKILQTGTPQKSKMTILSPKQNETPIKLERKPIDWDSIPEQPEGEWTCHWFNDEPVGQDSSLLYSEGRPIKTIIVRDNRLPDGWVKHIFQRSGLLGKWDIILETPTGKVYRSKMEMKQQYDEMGKIFDPIVFDFSLHKRRAKELGLCKYSPDYFASAHIQIPTPVKKVKIDTNAEASLITETTGSVVVEKKEEVLNEDFIMLGSVKVKIIENLLRCPGCDKNFRKENHLQIHIKHYHKELSEYLGVCPNMTDLAYLRTVGNTSTEETLPKNHLPNKQFFEKVHQHDMLSKTSRKSHSFTLHDDMPVSEGHVDINDTKMPVDLLSTPLSSKNTIKVDQNLEEAKKKFTLLEEALNAQPMIEKVNKPIEEAPIQIMKVVEPVSQTITKITKVIKPDHTDPELLIKSHSVSKSSVPFKIKTKFAVSARKKVSKLRTHISKMRVKQTPRLEAPTALNESFTEYDETRHSFGSPDVAFKRQKHSNPSMFADCSGQDTNSQNYSSMAETSQSPKYINEDGEVIKIVRMRQEEIINCICTFPEEDGLMIQCELCLCWQHGLCNGIERESEVPEKYICCICRNPTKGRNSLKYKHDQEWLYEGRLPTLIKQDNLKRENRYHLLKQSHTLSGNLLELKGFLHSLKVKINIAEKKDHPKMYLWSKKWETSPIRSDMMGISPLNNSRIKKYNENECLVKLENCDEKPDNLELNQLFSSQMGVKKEESKTQLYSNLTQSASDPNKESPLHNIEHRSPPVPNIPQPEAAIDPAECQLRLLEHIQKQQNAAMTRLQTIEDQLTKIESVDETSDKLENENFSRTKQTIQMLIHDLTTMRKIASTNCIDMYGGLFKSVE